MSNFGQKSKRAAGVVVSGGELWLHGNVLLSFGWCVVSLEFWAFSLKFGRLPLVLVLPSLVFVVVSLEFPTFSLMFGGLPLVLAASSLEFRVLSLDFSTFSLEFGAFPLEFRAFLLEFGAPSLVLYRLPLESDTLPHIHPTKSPLKRKFSADAENYLFIFFHFFLQLIQIRHQWFTQIVT
ncbi:hypothetical protein [Lentibacillus amyloliquefaciens]|uniref:hypothetical protein n=1 Tax=Lentibacillus amyloliquefaciens TaxID=1472767 RepID=UPI0012E36D83|nr:hypothetical protein [Lentibacillus amyloliquefaciens]